jgi:hypothetical protein
MYKRMSYEDGKSFELELVTVIRMLGLGIVQYSLAVLIKLHARITTRLTGRRCKRCKSNLAREAACPAQIP